MISAVFIQGTSAFAQTPIGTDHDQIYLYNGTWNGCQGFGGISMKAPGDPERWRRARVSLDGLSVGDAFGERFFGATAEVKRRIAARALPRARWRYTDDTAMALSIVEVLGAHGRIDQDALAEAFARRFLDDPDRGYGGMAREILFGIASAAFDGEGSMGNGGAMRAAPLGAWFADDPERVVAEARASAEVTHFHPEGQAGAIAVAAAAAWVARRPPAERGRPGPGLIEEAILRTPPGPTRDRLHEALSVPADVPVEEAVARLGNGSAVISGDTVPFALWAAAWNLHDFPGAMWRTVSGLGDRDTTCAIAGGVVALDSDGAGIPKEWLAAREPLA
jgi:ADP-ribosylglycohydrolase